MAFPASPGFVSLGSSFHMIKSLWKSKRGKAGQNIQSHLTVVKHSIFCREDFTYLCMIVSTWLCDHWNFRVVKKRR